MIELLKFSHDRKVPFKQSCDALRDIIDAFVEQSVFDDWYTHFERDYSLPRNMVKQQMKLWLEGSYDYQRCKFLDKLSFKKNLQSTVRYIGFLLYMFYYSKIYKETVNTYSLIVEWVESNLEIRRFSKLINLFNRENVLIIAVNSIVEPGYGIIYRPNYKLYDRRKVMNVLLKEIKNGLRIYLNLSRKLKVNLIPIASHIINQYLYYYSIFKYNRSKYCIQERHYQTSAIKNVLFHKFGGIYSCSIQKNLHQLGRNGFYYCIDVLFTLGTKTSDRAFQYGGKIKHVVPVGSVFMEYSWFNNCNRDVQQKHNYDVVFFGINAYIGMFFVDVYSEFLKDYYAAFEWLVQFHREYPNLRVGIKHHSSYKDDPVEMEIIKGSGIEVIDQTKNSYVVAFSSRCAVTYASTIGYELLAHKIPVLFIDPGGRCNYLPDLNYSILRPYRPITYEEFKNKIISFLSDQFLEGQKLLSSDELCLESSIVSERIHNWLLSYSG